VSKCRGDHHFVGVATIGIASRPAKPLAEVLLPGDAAITLPTRAVNPGHTCPLPNLPVRDAFPKGGHPSHDLVPQDNREKPRRESPLDLVQFGVADPTDRHLKEELSRTRRRVRSRDQLQWPWVLFQRCHLR